MTQLNDKERAAQMADMKSFDEEMPSIGIFWYAPEDHALFGVGKKELTPKMVGHWAEPVLDELTQLIEDTFHLPYFEFVYDHHWDLGHGWSGDMPK